MLAHVGSSGTVGFWRLLFLSTLFTSIGPMLYVFRLYATDRISDLDMSVRHEREAIFSAFVVFYSLGTIVLYLSHAPRVMIAAMLGYTLSTILVQFITRYWKISTHALGITAPLVALMMLYGRQPLPFLVLIPMVCWARVYLKAHTLLQVIAGAVLATLSTELFFHLFHVGTPVAISAQPMKHFLARGSLAIALALFPHACSPGPPFDTDDPVPTDYRNYEIYRALPPIASARDPSELPFLEINYGLMPNVQFSIHFGDAQTTAPEREHLRLRRFSNGPQDALHSGDRALTAGLLQSSGYLRDRCPRRGSRSRDALFAALGSKNGREGDDLRRRGLRFRPGRPERRLAGGLGGYVSVTRTILLAWKSPEPPRTTTISSRTSALATSTPWAIACPALFGRTQTRSTSHFRGYAAYGWFFGPANSPKL